MTKLNAVLLLILCILLLGAAFVMADLKQELDSTRSDLNRIDQSLSNIETAVAPTRISLAGTTVDVSADSNIDIPSQKLTLYVTSVMYFKGIPEEVGGHLYVTDYPGCVGAMASEFEAGDSRVHMTWKCPGNFFQQQEFTDLKVMIPGVGLVPVDPILDVTTKRP